MSSRQIRIPFTREEIEFINELAEADGVTFSAFVRHCIKLGLDVCKSEACDRLSEIAQESGVENFFGAEVGPELRAVLLRDTPKAGRLLKLMEVGEGGS